MINCDVFSLINEIDKMMESLDEIHIYDPNLETDN